MCLFQLLRTGFTTAVVALLWGLTITPTPAAAATSPAVRITEVVAKNRLKLSGTSLHRDEASAAPSEPP